MALIAKNIYWNGRNSKPLTPDIERHPLQPFLHLPPPALTRLHVLLRWRNPLALFAAGVLTTWIFGIFGSAANCCKESISSNLLLLISGIGYQEVWMLAYNQADNQVH